MPLTDDYRLQDIFSALARFNLVSITIIREAHLLDINEWDETTQLRYKIDDYNRCRQWMLPSMGSNERKLYHSDDSHNDLRRHCTSNKYGTG